MTKFSNSPFMDLVDMDQLVSMFDLISDTLFWIKDSESRIVFGNQKFLQHIGVSTISQALGKTDFDFSPPYVAQQFVIDDKKVMAGETVHDRLEMNIPKYGEIAWFVTSKRAFFDKKKQVIGSFGISKPLEKASLAPSGVTKLKAPIDYIRENFRNDISLDDLAKRSNLSISALERRFKKYMAKTPKQFISEVRLENARRLLVESSLPIALVAEECGFADHSYFSRQFRQFFGELPSAFRKHYLDEHK